MTVTASVPRHSDAWTVDDLADLPDDGNRYELIEGILLVSPAPALPHLRTVVRLHRLLSRLAPDHFAVGENGGVAAGPDTYFIPDLFVVDEATLDRDGVAFVPAEVHLAVEVLSPTGRGKDLVTKRYYYAAMGIPRYWVVDPKVRTLTVLVLDGKDDREDAVVKAGESWRTDEPFPLELDPAAFC